MNAHTHRLQRGLTLTELLIASTIGILVIGGAIAVFSANQTVGRTTEQYQLAQDDFRYVSQIITRVVRDGFSFDAATSASTLVVSYPSVNLTGLRNCVGAEPISAQTNRFALRRDTQRGLWVLECIVDNPNQTQTLMEWPISNAADADDRFIVRLLRPSVTNTNNDLGSLLENGTTAANASSVEVTIRLRRPNAPNNVQTRFVATMRCRVLACQ
ncbi:PilW family protein [Thiocapsa sp. UBA6158]|jgi:Tfp pilus assembly protein PilW|uniref:PilW family protein n=1 Tax=Thiocapsa sp. UBA6158 TaxID=1947692 RepID=UPI0025F40138|nr:hypothetical protein [Thiocapsa sp. UBA6158]